MPVLTAGPHPRMHTKPGPGGDPPHSAGETVKRDPGGGMVAAGGVVAAGGEIPGGGVVRGGGVVAGGAAPGDDVITGDPAAIKNGDDGATSFLAVASANRAGRPLLSVVVGAGARSAFSEVAVGDGSHAAADRSASRAIERVTWSTNAEYTAHRAPLIVIPRPQP